MNINERTTSFPGGAIHLTNFARGAKEGVNRFRILDIKYDCLQIKSGETKDVVNLQIQLANVQEPQRQETLQGYRVFIDYSYKSQFHQMILSAATALNKNVLSDICELVDLEGTATLSYYKPDDDRSFPRLSNWNFFVSSENMEAELSQYAEELAEDANIMEWEDSQ